MNDGAIGVFDSGMGGLSVWKRLYDFFPEESLLYFADGKNCPYGSRPAEEITAFTDQAVKWMVERNVKLIVLACNTATAASVKFLRSSYKIPIVGMEPAVKPAAISSRTGTIGVLATAASLEGGHFKRTSALYGNKVSIIPAVGEGFVELVENNKENTAETYDVVRNVLDPLISSGADKIVMGCTHYIFLKEVIREVVAGHGTELVDSTEAVVRRVGFLLDEKNLHAHRGNIPGYGIHSFAGEDYIRRLINKCRISYGMVIKEKMDNFAEEMFNIRIG